MTDFLPSEEQLHFIWQQGLFLMGLATTEGKAVKIIKRGELNLNDGPDFLLAEIRIDDKIWCGSIEIHRKASDWNLHSHSGNSRYDNVILHVVYKEDLEIQELVSKKVPTVELNGNIPTSFFKRYDSLLEQHDGIPCQDLIHSVEPSEIRKWLEFLFEERLEKRSEEIFELLEKYQNDWEQVMAIKLAEALGNKINKEAFGRLFQSTPFSVVRKYSQDIFKLESLLLGQAGFIEREMDDDEYGVAIKKEYRHQKNMHQLKSLHANEFKWMRLRPSNFPTVRLIQLAALYHKYQNLFSRCVEAQTIGDLRFIFKDISPSEYWQVHYDFSKPTAKKSKRLFSSAQIDLIIINAILPIRYAWIKKQSREENINQVYLIKKISAEKNSIISKYKDLGFPVESAIHSQAILSLNRFYCGEKKCLNCAIGQKILGDSNIKKHT